MKVVIDGIEYVPKADAVQPDDSKVKECIRELVSIQRFPECSHKHRAWAWDALNAIAPNIAELCGKDPGEAFDLVNPEDEHD